MHVSDAVIDSVELISLGESDISPMLEAVKIKVFYLGANRNGSYIDKPTALNMAKTLRGCPIVGYFREEKDDFTDHGDVVTVDDQGVHFNCNTRPYGFVDLNADIWFENYIDLDDFGNAVERTYLVTEGVVWVGQYPELNSVLTEGRPHSMELDEATIKGHWADDYKTNAQIFIINDAIFSKLCILGEDVEPCFEGSSVTAPEVSSSFTLKADEFTSTLFTMMKDLKELTFSLKEQGGNSMATLDNGVQAPKNDAPATQMNLENPAPEISEAAPAEDTSAVAENSLAEQGTNEQQVSTENQNNTEEFTKAEEKDDDDKEDDKDQNDDANDDDSNDDEAKDDDDKKKPTKNELEGEEKYAVLEQQFSELSEKYTSLEQQNAELLAFKQAAEDKEKDALIAQFYMLSDEDKKEVIDNKSKYSLDDIEAKLSVICVRKKVNFENNDSEAEQNPAVTFNLNSVESEELPAWLKAVESHGNRNN